MDTTPYATLHPDLILDAIDSVGYRSSGSLLALNSFENRVYQVGIEEDKPLIAKFYRPSRWSDAAILEEHQFSQELVEHEIPIVAPLAQQGQTLHFFKTFRFALFPRKGGRAFEVDNLEQLEWMGRFLGRLHAVSACRPFKHRLELNIQNHGYEPYQFLMNQNFIPAHLRPEYSTTVEMVLQLCKSKLAQVGAVSSIRLHGDCHPGNILWNDEGPHIVDLDDALMGPAIQDLWMLLSGTKEEMRVQLNQVLYGYLEFFDFDYKEIKLIEVLRTQRMLHYSAWLAKRWQDPAFPLSFPWFNTNEYWEEQLKVMLEQKKLLEIDDE